MNKLSSAIVAMVLAVTVAGSATAQPNAQHTLATNPAPLASAKEAPVDPASLALAHQILAIGIPAEKRPEMFSSLTDLLKEQARKSTENLGLTNDKDLQAVMDRSTQRMLDEMKPIMKAAIPDIFESMARAYAREFSTADLKSLLAFVKTPAGQRFFERAPMILKDPDVQAANQRMTAQLMTKLPDIMRENLRDIQDYVARKQQEQKTSAKAPVS